MTVNKISNKSLKYRFELNHYLFSYIETINQKTSKSIDKESASLVAALKCSLIHNKQLQRKC